MIFYFFKGNGKVFPYYINRGDRKEFMKRFLFIAILIFILFFNTSKAYEIDKIVVDIKGAVLRPGMYEIDSNSTVYDLIGQAGGLMSYADTSLINLSKRLSDQDVVVIYTIDEVESLTSGDTAIKVIEKECMCPKIENIACFNKNNNIGIININTASLEELQKLSGVGKSKAEAIIEYRNNNRFTSAEEITKVKGIGKSIYEKNKDNIGI